MLTCQKQACFKKCFKCTTLEVTPLVIDFNFDSGEPKARFNIGQCLGNKKIKVIATIVINGLDTVVTEFPNIVTDADGGFEFDIPLETTAVDITVTTLLLVTYDPICERRTVCVTFGGQYNPYSSYDLVWRTYDGSENNLNNPEWGQADRALRRQAASDYEDGSSTLAVRGPSNPNPRIVSNNVCKAPPGGSPDSFRGLRDITWMWGQFLDHELDLTNTGAEEANVITPDVMTDPEEDYPGRTILFNRSEAVVNSDPREHPNHISAFIDATNVYGYTSQRAMALRRLDGTGKLKTLQSDNGEDILIYNLDGLENAAPPASTASDFFLAGDPRSNENIFLTGMHTLWMREHNRLCDHAVQHWPHLAGKEELIFQHARRHVAGMMQAITYNEFLPALGIKLPPYTGYKADVDPTINTEFSTVGYRLGHTMLSSLLRTGPAPTDTILLRDAFFLPSYVQANGVDDLLYGGTIKLMQEIDRFVVEDIRSFLFGPPTMTNLLDLAVLNIQRGRDHGIPGYNAVREAYGLPSYSSFLNVVGPDQAALATTLTTLYGHPDYMDPWIGCLVEPHIVNTNLGPLLHAILTDQFVRLRDGDRYWYQIDPALPQSERDEIHNTTLAQVLTRNTRYTYTGNVFKPT